MTLQAEKLSEKAVSPAQPTAKALEYKTNLEKEAANPRLKAARRLEIEEDLGKIANGLFLNYHDVTHFVVDEGPKNGEAVVFVHGWDCSSFWWHAVIPELNKAGYRTINYDLRGHGFSSDPPEGREEYSIDNMVEDLETLRRYLKIEKFHLANFSLGAVVATAYAARYPERVASLACFNFGLFKYNPTVEKVMPKVLSTIFSRALRGLGPGGWRLVYGYVRLSLTKNPVAKRDILYGLLSLRDCSARASYHSARSIMSRPILETLPKWAESITAPTLLVAGSHDRVIGRKNAENLAKIFPNVNYFVMPKCGHLVLGELPEQVVSLMLLHLGSAKFNQLNL
jgi:pimeloyl-ACP methyl ester carboxylesterase